MLVFYFILDFNKKGQHKGQVCLGIELREVGPMIVY